MDTWALKAVERSQNSASGAILKSSTSKANLFHCILSSPNLSAAEKDYRRIAQEAFVAIVAGGETTGRVLATGTFHILANRSTVLPRLQQELRTIMPDPSTRPTLKELERLPWLVRTPPPSSSPTVLFSFYFHPIKTSPTFSSVNSEIDSYENCRRPLSRNHFGSLHL